MASTKQPKGLERMPVVDSTVQTKNIAFPNDAELMHKAIVMLHREAKGRDGDRANAVLAAAGYNFGLLLRWFEALLQALIAMIFRTAPTSQTA